jgi:thiamine biosynthesis lipoprotein
MGTVVSFDVRTPAPPAAIGSAIEEAETWLRWVDDTFSTYKQDSEVNRFDRGELAQEACCGELRSIITLCLQFNKGTNGFFDAWAGPRFDPSGVVKGWSIDRASDILAAHGLGDHIIDGGGDIRLRGSPSNGAPWTVGVRHPLQPDGYAAALSVSAGAVATSGTYERGLHVLDPFTGRPAAGLASATVVGPDLTTADAYATAALAMGGRAPDWLLTLNGYEAQVITPKGTGWSTPGFRHMWARGRPAGPAT